MHDSLSRQGDNGHHHLANTTNSSRPLPRDLDDDEVVGGTGWKMLKKDEIPKGEEVDIATAIERFNRRKEKRGDVDVEDAMDGVEMAHPQTHQHHQHPPQNHLLISPHVHTRPRTNTTEIQMRGPSGSTTSAAAPPSPLPSPTGSPAPSFFFGPPVVTTPPPSAPLHLDGTITTTTTSTSTPPTTGQSHTGPLQPDVQLTTLLTLPSLLQQYSALPSSLQSHVILTFLRQSPMPVLRSVNAILAPTLSRDFLTQLPAELVSIILSFLPGRSLAQCTRVSKAWRAIIDSDPILWRELLRTTGSWFGGGAERAFARTLTNRREIKALRQQHHNSNALTPTPSPLTTLDLPHPYKVLFKSRQLTRTQWQSNLNPRRVSFAAHGSSVVTCLLFSHNRIISASDDHSIHVYNPLTGQLIKSLEGHGGGVWALAATKDTLVSGSTDRTVRIWDLEKGRCTHVFGGHKSTVRCLAIVKPEMLDIEVEEPGSSSGATSVGDGGAAGPTTRRERWPKRTLIVTGSRDHTLRVWKLPKAHEPSFVFMPEEEGPDHVEVRVSCLWSAYFFCVLTIIVCACVL
jgi:F-box and WD-40 domain protein CDC4